MATDPTVFSTPHLDIYFQSQRASLDAHLPTRLADFIAATQATLDCAIYDLRDATILAALKQVADRGLQLRIAYDQGKQPASNHMALMADPKPGSTADALAQAGLTRYATPIHEGKNLMHDKVLVRDGRAVWTGSANFTVGGLTLQDNNCLALDSDPLAQRYAAVVEDLLAGHHRHVRTPRQRQGAASQPVQVGDVVVTPVFAPAQGEGIEDTIVNDLAGAQRVRILAFLISDPGILQALEPFADDPRLDIQGVYDLGGMKDVLRQTRQDPRLFWFTADPRFVKAPSHPFSEQRENDFMHNKVMIIDDRIVLTGSYNFSENAELNDENLLRIESPAVAAAYTRYFDTLYRQYGGTPAV